MLVSNYIRRERSWEVSGRANHKFIPGRVPSLQGGFDAN